MPDRKAEVGIVGAGPAGAWAAYRLARAGARVVVFDPSHPREKPCGGGLTARALALVAEALPPDAIDAVAIEAAEFTAGDRAPVAVPLGRGADAPRPALAVASRRAFDGALLRAACAAGAIHIPARVIDVAVDRRGVRLVTRAHTWHVPLVLGADGATSLVRRRTVGPFPRTHLSLAAGVYVDGVSWRRVAIHFPLNPAGYLWAFPRRDHLAVGACAPATEATPAALHHLVTRWVTRAGLAAGPVARYTWPIPSLDGRQLDRERPADDRWLLLGDAAGLVDPLTREGIFFALQSAEFAAATLVTAPRRAAREYTARLADEIYPELRRAARLAGGFFHGPFVMLLLDALARSGAIRAVLADLVAGRQPYGSLKRRLLGTFEWGLAWRLLTLERLRPSAPVPRA